MIKLIIIFGATPALTVLLLAIFAGVSFASEMEFTLKLPLDKKYKINTKTTREKLYKGVKKTVEELVAVTEVGVELGIGGDGYALIHKTISAKATRNGEVIEMPLIDILMDRDIVYEVGEDGELYEIYGYEMIDVDIKEYVKSPEMRKSLSNIDEDVLKDKERAEWNSRIANFVGKKIRFGEKIISYEAHEIPNVGEINLFTITELSEDSSRQSSICINIHFEYSSDIKEIAKSANMTVSEILEKASVEEFAEKPSMRISGFGNRIIDPSTMMIYSETLSRTIVMNIATSNNELSEVIVNEKKEHIYSY